MVQAAAHCKGSVEGHEVKYKPLLTCSVEACQKGAQACKSAPVTKEQFKAIAAARKTKQQPSVPTRIETTPVTGAAE
jgi:hypothetical protein